MPYIFCFLSVGFVLTLQYFLSHWLIKIGWFYGYAWVMGGFIFFIFIAGWLLMLSFKKNIHKYNPKYKDKTDAEIRKLSIKTGNQQSNAVKLCIVLVLLGGFWLNLELNKFHEKYEYETFGITTKAVITKKYELQNKGHSYHFILQIQEMPQPQKLEISVLSGQYARRKIGDTLNVLYTPRYSGMTKILPAKK